MKKIRNRFYMAILPLQLLLMGLIIWTVFLLHNLEGLVRDTEENQKRLGDAMDNAVVRLVEMELLVRLIEETPDVRVQRELESAWQYYEDAVERIRLDERLQMSKAMRALYINNERLNERIQSLIDTEDPSPVDEVQSTIRMIEKTEGLLGQLSAAAINDILGLQTAFRERIRLSFYVLGLGIGLGVIGTILISYQIGRIVVRPMELLQQKLDEVGKGNYDQEVHLSRKDEIGLLANALNRMIRNLRLYRNMTDDRLNRTAHTFNMVLQQSPHALLFLTKDLKVSYANPQAGEMLSSPEWSKGLPESLVDLVTDTQQDHHITVHRELHEAIQVKINGQPRYYLIACYPVEILHSHKDVSENDRDGVALSLQDVTKMKLADDIKGNLVATVSHELKTPLTSARMALYLLGEQQIGTLNEDQLDLVDTAKEDLERQLATIQNLLDLSRAENDSDGLSKERCRVRDIIEESVATHADLSRASEITIEVEHATESFEILVDPHKVTIVLNNFISNALRHSDRGSRILVKSERFDQSVRCSVRDFGQGIEEELMPRLFNRFSQGSDSKKVGAAGLGLHISKEIINRHDGQIGCDSWLGQGSEFYFILPLMEEDLNLNEGEYHAIN